ncbi:MAG: sigma-54-dependent Fis family transcriptional regulator [Sedimentisphaerales bacterium]|nr:sigma-54-dependent Fis family transcriptional regulator [Sedimentisphaerales bacterium]
MALQSIIAVSRGGQLQQIASRFAQKVLVADEPKEAFDLLRTSDCELALFEDTFTAADIEHFIKTTDKHSINIPVLIISNGKKRSDNPFRNTGAIAYLCAENEKDKIEQLLKDKNFIIEHEKAADLRQDYFLDDVAAAVSLAGTSSSMQKTLQMIKLVSKSNCNPILVIGQTGTGKELAAKAVHYIRCHDKSFVAVNCAALTANLLESELFGHVKGSFTGADKDKVGLFELAGEGTVFLDEISEMPLGLQAKLLRVLQEKTFMPVGGTKLLTCKGTIIASSNRNLLEAIGKKRFRQDLYYRLNVCPIKLYPLNSPNRREDIRLLAEYFLRHSNVWPDKSSNIKSITPLALETLEKHDWQGNVRELKNVIDRAILLETTDKIGLSSIIIEKEDDLEQNETNPTDSFSLEAAERELIARALKETGWQKTKAAALLGITRATLYAKVKQYNIKDYPTETNNAKKPVSLPELVPA